MNYKEKYIDIYAKYIQEKNIKSRIYEEEYINNFGDIEIQHMQNVYEYMVIDSKIANKFMYTTTKLIDIELANQTADIEFEDLYKQIQKLKYRKKINSSNLEYFNKYSGKKTLENLKKIIKKIDPNINSTKIAKRIWNDFLFSIEEGELCNIDYMLCRIENIKVRKVNFTEKDYKRLYMEVRKDLKNLSEMYPNNLERLFNSDKNMNSKYKEVELDLRNSKEALDYITSMYLQVYDSEGLES